MLRELSQLLQELHDGLHAIEIDHGMRLAAVDMTLPLEVRPVLRNGGCVLLADVPRSSDPAWRLPLSHLRVGFGNPAENAA